MFEMKNEQQSILIVDDMPKNIQILGNILYREGFKLSYAQSGEEALELIQMNPYDLILLDIMMPQMNGYDVCERIRGKESTREIPIIFLTAKTDKESIVKGLCLGAQDYIMKPFSSEELIQRVKTHLLIRSQKEQLKNVNKTLEKKVEERTNQLRIANEQLKSLEKAKSEFLSIISHELRTPLNGIMGLTDLLKNSIQSKENREYINYLKEASERLARFSETAILITTLKSEQYKFNFTSQKIKYLIENIFESYEERFRKKNITLEIGAYEDDLQINIDFDLIKTCLENLLNNALKFSPKGSRVRIDIDQKKEFTNIGISDEGPGFNRQAMNNMFEYFSNAETSHFEGIGLSLAATKLIMDAHQGKIHIENSESAGARVCLRFPN